MFLENCGEVIRVLCGNKEGNWVISYDNPCTPKFVLRDDLRAMERIEPPKDFQMRMTQEEAAGTDLGTLGRGILCVGPYWTQHKDPGDCSQGEYE
jgi:hypothetical protein